MVTIRMRTGAGKEYDELRGHDKGDSSIRSVVPPTNLPTKSHLGVTFLKREADHSSRPPEKVRPGCANAGAGRLLGSRLHIAATSCSSRRVCYASV